MTEIVTGTSLRHGPFENYGEGAGEVQENINVRKR